MTLREQCEARAYAIIDRAKATSTTIDKEDIADAIEKAAREFAEKALKIALASPSVRVEFYPTNPPRSLAPKIIAAAIEEAAK